MWKKNNQWLTPKSLKKIKTNFLGKQSLQYHPVNFLQFIEFSFSFCMSQMLSRIEI